MPGIGDPPILIFRWRHLWASTTSGAQLTLSPAGKRSCRLGEDSFRQSLSLYVGFGVCQVGSKLAGRKEISAYRKDTQAGLSSLAISKWGGHPCLPCLGLTRML